MAGLSTAWLEANIAAKIATLLSTPRLGDLAVPYI